MAAVDRYGRASDLAPADDVITVEVIDRLRTELATLPVEDLKADLRSQ